nr:MAG: hypothetical protein ACD_22C00195G0005 [uncultured bacterium]
MNSQEATAQNYRRLSQKKSGKVFIKFKERRNNVKAAKTKVFWRKMVAVVKPFAVVVCVAAIGVAGYFALFKSSFFIVDAINITGTKNFVSLSDITEVTKNRVFGKSIFDFKEQELESVLASSFKGAKEIEVTKKLPSTVDIVVMERTPLALIFNTDPENPYMVDEDGYVLGLVEKDKTNLPEIKYEGDINVGSFVDETMVPVFIELIAALNEREIDASSMSFHQRYERLFVTNGVEVLIANDKNKSESVAVLETLLKQLALEGKKVKKIDLRYDKVIVSYD